MNSKGRPNRVTIIRYAIKNDPPPLLTANVGNDITLPRPTTQPNKAKKDSQWLVHDFRVSKGEINL